MATVLGKVVAEYLSGTAREDLDFPIKGYKPVFFRSFQKRALPLAIWYKKLLDRWDV